MIKWSKNCSEWCCLDPEHCANIQLLKYFIQNYVIFYKLFSRNICTWSKITLLKVFSTLWTKCREGAGWCEGKLSNLGIRGFRSWLSSFAALHCEILYYIICYGKKAKIIQLNSWNAWVNILLKEGWILTVTSFIEML